MRREETRLRRAVPAVRPVARVAVSRHVSGRVVKGGGDERGVNHRGGPLAVNLGELLSHRL